MINWERVTALRNEVGPEDFDEIVELFLVEVDEEITTLAGGGQYETLAEKLHFLKGSAMSLGFQDFSELCQAGEVSLLKNPNSDIDLNEIAASFQTTRAVFIDELPNKYAS